MGEVDLILGTAGISAPYGILRPQAQIGSADDWVSSLGNLQTLGFSAIDTAPVYGNAESLLGRAGVTIPIHTKLSLSLDPIQSLEQSLARIRRKGVSILYFHDTFDLDENQVEQIAALASVRGTLYEELGASIYDENEYRKALSVPEIDVIQVPFSVLDRRFGDAWLSAAKHAGKRVFARSVFLQGTLISGPNRLPAALSTLAPSIAGFAEICEAWSTSPMLAALGYVQQKEGFSGIIAGAKTPAEASNLADLYSKPIPPGLVRDLDSLITPSWAVTDPRTWRAPRVRHL